MKPAPFFAALFAVIFSARLCHMNILWAEESLPLATAGQMLAGRTLYRNVWFDKPPLVPATYLLWGSRPGWLLRLAGSLCVLLACGLIFHFARSLWSAREGFWAAGLLAFYLTLDIPSAVIPLASDLLMLSPHVAAVCLAWRRRAFWSGVAAGIAFAVNAKGLFVLAACAIWCLRSLPLLLAGFALPNLCMLAWLGSHSALDAYWEQVWRWGRVYAGSTFIDRPIWNAFLRTAHWLGFHAALVLAAGLFLHRAADRWRWVAWLAISSLAVAAGWRFFPRYFFQLLPAVTLAAARGFTGIGLSRSYTIRLIAAALLFIPLVRFGPRYVILANDLIHRREHEWRDVAMDRDSRTAARLASSRMAPGDTLLVWGFRPELYVYTGLPAASRFLDSQPLTGVPADRHLTQTQPLAADLARDNRAELTHSRPTLIMDGLGLYNSRLAIEAFPDLRAWLAQYEPAEHTQTVLFYRRVNRAEYKEQTH